MLDISSYSCDRSCLNILFYQDGSSVIDQPAFVYSLNTRLVFNVVRNNHSCVGKNHLQNFNSRRLDSSSLCELSQEEGGTEDDDDDERPQQVSLYADFKN